MAPKPTATADEPVALLLPPIAMRVAAIALGFALVNLEVAHAFAQSEKTGFWPQELQLQHQMQLPPKSNTDCQNWNALHRF